MDNDKQRSAFIKVGKGGKIGNLTIEDSNVIGDADFISNDGEIGSASLSRNRYFIAPKLKPLVQAIKKPSANDNKGWKIMIVGTLLAPVLTVAGMAVYDFHVKPTLNKMLIQQTKTEAIK